MKDNNIETAKEFLRDPKNYVAPVFFDTCAKRCVEYAQSLTAQGGNVTDENKRLKESIHWALGYSDFKERYENKGQYYWRKELLERSGMTNEDLIRISEAL